MNQCRVKRLIFEIWYWQIKRWRICIRSSAKMITNISARKHLEDLSWDRALWIKGALFFPLPHYHKLYARYPFTAGDRKSEGFEKREQVHLKPRTFSPVGLLWPQSICSSVCGIWFLVAAKKHTTLHSDIQMLSNVNRSNFGTITQLLESW